MRLCRCGAVTKKGLCDKCQPKQTSEQRGTTAQRGYGNDWRTLSERERKERPICEVCDAKGIATPAKELHHIEPIKTAEHLRLDRYNTLSVCRSCHDGVEGMGPTQLEEFLKKLRREFNQ